MKIITVGFSDGEFGHAKVELVAFDLADGTEVDDIGPVGADEVLGQKGDEL